MKGNKIWKKALCLVLALTMVLGNASPVVAAHEHETAAEIVTEITNATIKEAEKVIDKTGLLNAADVTDTKNALEEADSNLAGSMDNLGTAVENAEAAIDALDGKVTKDDAAEINASLSVAYGEASSAWENAVAVSDEAVADLEKVAEAYEAASKISDEAAKVAEAELKAAQEALNAAVEATKFANDNMTNLKNEFAKATELATKWSTEVETALAEATVKFEEAQAALNSALEALESEDADLKAAIDTFKASYDAFIAAANTFKTSIQTAIDAQANLEALYAEYEAAQAAYAEALAAYEAKCAEYEAAELLNTYEGYTEALKTLNEDLEELKGELEKAEGIEASAKATWEAALLGEDYLAMKELADILATVPETDEEKATVEKAAYEAAVYVIEKKLANGRTVINVDKDGNNAEGIPTYGKAAEDYFVVLNEKGEAVSRYDYKLNYDENGKGVVNIYEMLPTDDVTNYVDYNGAEKELHLVAGTENQYYIEVGSDKIDLVKNENNEYVETLVAEQTFAENPAGKPLEVNAAGLIQYVIKNMFNIDLPLKNDADGYYVEVNLIVTKLRVPIEVNVKLQKDENNDYFVKLLEGVEILEQSLEITLPVEVTKKADNSGYDVKYVYYEDMLYTEEQLANGSVCINAAHDSKYGHANVVECDVPLHVRYNNHAASFEADCVSHMTEAECKAAPCNKELHKTYGHDSNTITGTCTVHEDIKVSYLFTSYTYPAHKVENGVIKGLVSATWKKQVYENATCGVELNGPCSTCTAGTVEIQCPGPFGFCNKERRTIDVHGTVFEKTLPQAVYEGKEYKVQGSNQTGLYIEIPAVVEGEVATKINLKFVKTGEENGLELGYYTYEVKHTFVQGGTADTVFAAKETALGVDSNVYAKEVAELENTYLACGEECDRIAGLITDKEEEIVAFKATYADLVSAYDTMVAAETLATEKELGALAELPKNISEMVEGMEVEEMLALLDAIVKLSSQSDDVDYKEVLEVLSDVVDANAATRLIAVLAYDAISDGLGSISPFGLFDDIMNGIGGIIDGIGEQITPPTEFEKAYANAWVDALTTKIKVVQNAIKLVETAVDTVEAGVTAVTEGIELAEVAADAVLATAEKKLLEATVEVLVMANDVLNSSEEIVLSIDSIIAEAQARTEAAYLAAVAESNALNQVTITRPYAAKLDEALVAIGTANALNTELAADIALAEAPLASAKALYEELKYLEEHEHKYESVTTDPSCTEAGSIVYTCTICTHTYTEALEATGHSYDSVVTAPTCTEAGYTTYTCTTCGDSYVADEEKALGHDYESVVTNPSCTAGGHTTHTCKVCGDSYVDAKTEATGHAYVTEEKAATCTEDGYVVYACDACGDTYTEILPKLGHELTTVTVEATCTEAGSKTTTCSRCDYNEVETIEALDHEFTTVTVEATCTEAGSITTTCSRCDYNKVETIEALGHELTTVTVNATCETAGTKTTTCSRCDYNVVETIPATGHKYETTTVEATCTEDGSVTEKCACGYTIVTIIPAKGHAYESVVTEPTCTAKGYTTHTCANCGDAYTDTEVAATGHNFDAVVTAPTCTAEGYTTHTCSKCGSSYVDSKVAANGHTWGEWEVTVEPTEEAFGEKVRECTVDGCDATEVASVDKLPHTHVWNEGVVTAPTCTKVGYTTYTCTKCQATEVRNEVAALGHSYEAVVTAPTCTKVGYTTYTCHCSDSYVADEVAATGHSFGAWVVTTPATEFEAGLETRTCHCGATETQEIAAIGHTYAATVTVPTCTEQGYTTYTCECGHSYVADYVEALGHSETAVVTAPTCTAEGYTTYTCGRCGNVRTADTTSALNHDYIPAVTAPTCTAEGYTTYTCSRGDHSYVADYVEALGHSFGEWTVEENATCTEDGKEARICGTCGEKEERTIEALGHAYDAVVTAPTCVTGGYTTYTCNVCGDSYVADEVAAKGHSYDVRVTEPTCTTGGHTTYVCACGVYETGYETEALGHTWGAWTVTTAATETATGLETRECAICHATEVNVLAMLEAAPVADETVEIEEEETPLANGEEEKEDDETIVIEDEETPLSDGSDMVEIEEEEVPLSDGDNSNVGMVVAVVGGVAVAGTGAAVVANQAGLLGTGAASAAATGTAAGTGIKGLWSAIAAFFKKLFRK